MGISRGNCSLVHSLATCSRARETIAELAWEIPRERRFSVGEDEKGTTDRVSAKKEEVVENVKLVPRRRTLRIVLLLLWARPVDLGDMGGRVTCLWLFVVAALIENLRQVGSVDLPELLVIIQSSTEVPVFTFGTQRCYSLIAK